ncbi:unnamed protein product [Protopolystoma xenopodis]|uniref:Uncharacterized protein n=1 Tax=Protopolystoma xenopodis TaxID=117903 RepID=A0A448WI42_9PLAT|nr:unnamed protein product [Protopolystoma xenopodis]
MPNLRLNPGVWCLLLVFAAMGPQASGFSRSGCAEEIEMKRKMRSTLQGSTDLEGSCGGVQCVDRTEHALTPNFADLNSSVSHSICSNLPQALMAESPNDKLFGNV